MKPLGQLPELIEFLKSENILLNSSQKEMLEYFYEAVLAYSAKHNIISKNDQKHIIDKHIAGSFYFVKILKEQFPVHKNILDLGSGAGFPGVILSIYFKSTYVVMIDSVRKKTLFLKRVIDDLNLNALVVNDRIEAFIGNNKIPFEILTARALASIDDLVTMCTPLLTKATLHTIKGENYLAESVLSQGKCDIKPYNIAESWVAYSGFLKNKTHIALSMT